MLIINQIAATVKSFCIRLLKVDEGSDAPPLAGDLGQNIFRPLRNEPKWGLTWD